MAYAFDAFPSLVSRLSPPISAHEPVVRYLCALISELAYHHVPSFEIDTQKRALVIPCKAHKNIVATRIPTSVLGYVQEMQLQGSFAVVDRRVVVVGIFVKNFAFVGFRGTCFLYDWWINIHAPLVRRGAGRVHRGFFQEAIRVSARITHEILKIRDRMTIDHIFLAGHSLGGAVAALSEDFFGYNHVSVCMFGAPRYCDLAAYENSFSRYESAPTQIQRAGDIVPFVPPRALGYANHPLQFDTKGNYTSDELSRAGKSGVAWQISPFFREGCEPHSMEYYRSELGHTANIPSADLGLAPFEKLKRSDLA